MACFLSSRLSLSIHSHASYSNLLCPLLDARWRVQQNIKRSVSTTHTDLFGYGTVYMVKVKLSSLPIPRLVVVVNSYCNISLTPISPWNWLFAFGFLDALEGILMPIDSNRLNIDIGHGARSSLRNQQQEKRGKLPNLVSLKFLVGFFPLRFKLHLHADQENNDNSSLQIKDLGQQKQKKKKVKQ